MLKVKFLTFGCKVNQYETQLLREQFKKAGFLEVFKDELTSYYVINTCTVTAHADTDARNACRVSLKKNPSAKIIITGCYKRKEWPKDIKNNKSVVFIENKCNLLNYLTKFRKKHALNYISEFDGHSRAFVKIQDGCNNFCSYCKIPYVRGSSISRDPEEILIEIDNLLKKGYEEIVLTGICLGSFGKDLNPKLDLTKLLKLILAKKGHFRVRLSSIELTDISKKLVSIIMNSPKVCKHLHIPLQSGDDKILKDMNRHYSASTFSNIIKYIKKKIPKIAFTTDILLGFPGEDEESFKNTLELLTNIRPMRMHIFTYSPRPGTLSYSKYAKEYKLTNFKELKERRLTLESLNKEFSNEYSRLFIKNRLEVLVEGKKDGYYQGYTDNYINIKIKSCNSLKSRLLPIVIQRVTKDRVFAAALS